MTTKCIALINIPAAFYAALPEIVWARSWPVEPVLIIARPVERQIAVETAEERFYRDNPHLRPSRKEIAQQAIMKSWTIDDDKRVRLHAWKRFHRVR